MHDASENTVPAAIESLIELFHTDLADVRFPDVDGDALSALTNEVHAAAAEVARAEEALAAAVRALGQQQELLLQKSHRALAYARIFAEEDPELLTRLDALQLPRGARKSGTANAPDAAEPARRRGRPRKNPEAITELFQHDPSAEIQASA